MTEACSAYEAAIVELNEPLLLNSDNVSNGSDDIDFAPA